MRITMRIGTQYFYIMFYSAELLLCYLFHILFKLPYLALFSSASTLPLVLCIYLAENFCYGLFQRC